MKITCTEEEKTALVELMCGNDYRIPCCYNLSTCDKYEDCRTCIANEIEWTIEESKQ